MADKKVKLKSLSGEYLQPYTENVPLATTSKAGLVQPDGTTVTIANGKISAKATGNVDASTIHPVVDADQTLTKEERETGYEKDNYYANAFRFLDKNGKDFGHLSGAATKAGQNRLSMLISARDGSSQAGGLSVELEADDTVNLRLSGSTTGVLMENATTFTIPTTDGAYNKDAVNVEYLKQYIAEAVKAELGSYLTKEEAALTYAEKSEIPDTSDFVTKEYGTANYLGRTGQQKFDGYLYFTLPFAIEDPINSNVSYGKIMFTDKNDKRIGQISVERERSGETVLRFGASNPDIASCQGSVNIYLKPDGDSHVRVFDNNDTQHNTEDDSLNSYDVAKTSWVKNHFQSK